MFRLVFVSILAAMVAAGTVPFRPRLDGRILGGSAIDIRERPFQVTMQLYGSHICGGSIIADKWVVTAAHCTDGLSAAYLNVRAGTSYRNVGGVVVNVGAIHQHPKYDHINIDYDISLLELVAPLTFDETIQPAPLPSLNQVVPPGADAIVSGWGSVSEGGALTEQLQAVKVQIVSQADCNDAYGSGMITDRMTCAGAGGGKDACQGDSGGPLTVNGQLIGIVSWGFGCGRPSYPGVYGSVPALRDFITDTARV